jgi:hypothetical protein
MISRGSLYVYLLYLYVFYHFVCGDKDRGVKDHGISAGRSHHLRLHAHHGHHPHAGNKTRHEGGSYDERPDSLPHLTKLRRCGGPKHTAMTRPCALNDTICGQWKGRYWHPISCRYEDITPEQARKCLGNRTLAFIGDSQIRDTAVGVAFFLLGQKLEDSPSYKFDNKGDLTVNGTRIPNFDSWKHNVPGHNYNGYVFPQPEVAAKEGYQWQVQIWNLFRIEFQAGQANQVLNNEMVSKFAPLRPIDLAFYSYGLHDYGWFNEQPHGEKFYGQMIRRWKEIRMKASVPSVWVSMNSECRRLIKYSLSNMDLQAFMVEEVNWYLNQQLLKEKLPYWDATAVLRSPQRCNVSDDGVHVKMFVDIMRAKMLFNHLCDSDMNWRGSPDLFI